MVDRVRKDTQVILFSWELKWGRLKPGQSAAAVKLSPSAFALNKNFKGDRNET